ncbi:glucose-6-phosphate exchanger SLC37A2-like [Paramacrobiotus metropolitanus]|uniref:glucose-6-phosphate exchanger SLC37A2-like n=1 Tax=Paramacrobiotus metropolitanus TaxID=2943436 RepID=UPI00244586D0|nr:glucose-6-phosphate exchanger SLC37A2-like [Paramacrobiotus metropolitanus]
MENPKMATLSPPSVRIITSPSTSSSDTITSTASRRSDNVPYGISLLRRLPRFTCCQRNIMYQAHILILTYILYVAYHITRRPMGIVKNTLKQSCVNMTPPPDIKECDLRNGTWCAWQPFDKDSEKLFSVIDFTYRFAYAGGIFIAGYIAERTNTRIFLACGMMVVGAWSIANGMAYFWQIHAFSYFVVCQFFGGLFQGTGWPTILGLLGTWFGKHRRGLIFGIWNSDTCVGNMLGAVIAGLWVNHQWGYSFIVPGLIMIGLGFVAFFFVVNRPEDVGLQHPDYVGPSPLNTPEISLADIEKLEKDVERIEATIHNPVEQEAISVLHAIRIPGVVEFSFSLFFCKAAYYAFFFWLPVYIKETSHGRIDNHAAADVSAVFDAGGIVGGILAGYLSDVTGGSATISGGMFLLAIPVFYLMTLYASQSTGVLIVLLLVIGLLSMGPYTLITTAVSAELGTRPNLVKNKKAVATVAGIIDGMGALGSAFGPLTAGLLSVHGWLPVIYMLMVAQTIALLCLGRLIYHDIRRWIRKGRKAIRKRRGEQRNYNVNSTASTSKS